MEFTSEMDGDEAVYARILSRVDRPALDKHCAIAFGAELRDAQRSLQQAREALRALRELGSAARFLRGRRLLGDVAPAPSEALLGACSRVLAVNARVSEALERVVGDPKADAETTCGAVLRARNACEGAVIEDIPPVADVTLSKKRKLSEASVAVTRKASPKIFKSDRDSEAETVTCGGPREEVKAELLSEALESPTVPMAASAAFDPSESPVELPVPDSDSSDTESKLPTARSSCLDSARRLERGTAANQLSRFPALTQQLQTYVQSHRRELETEATAQEFVDAVGIATRIGRKLQFLPSVRDALVSLLTTVEALEQVVDPLPSPLNEDVESLLLHFLRMTKPQVQREAEKE